MRHFYAFCSGAVFYAACSLGFRDGMWHLAALALVAAISTGFSALAADDRKRS